MKKHITVSHQEVCELICDGCGLQAYADNDFEFSEFMSISHQCGYDSIHGDGKQITMDICQYCFADMCGDVLTVIDPVDNQSTDSPEESLEYDNIFQAITQSKQKANELKQNSDIRISARSILTQLLINVIKPSESCSEIYYTEDSKLIDLLNELVTDETEVAEVPANDIDELLMLHNEMLEFFGSQVDVYTWMHTELPSIGNKKPISLLSTTQGRKTLKQVLSQMSYGDFF